MKAWHFIKKDRTFQFGDARKLRVGSWLVHKDELELCYSGLHSSRNINDVLIIWPL